MAVGKVMGHIIMLMEKKNIAGLLKQISRTVKIAQNMTKMRLKSLREKWITEGTMVMGNGSIQMER